MKYSAYILFLIIMLSVFGCTDNWDEHYNSPPETINTNVWEAVKAKSELSSFVALMEKYRFDTLFLTDDTYTLFVPDNSAIARLQQSQVSDTTILKYHISRHFVQPVDIQGKRKLQTLAEKYSTFDRVDGQPTYDGIALTFESPLYVNGKFFIMSEVALPRLNLYEYIARNNVYLKAYIDSKDSTILDREKSKPIGFNKQGETIYDTVAIKYNSFEEGPTQYFPVSQEFRKWTATIAFPRQANYENALTVMAQKLGGSFKDYKDIPVKWQQDILIPHLVKHGIFLNMLEPNEFKTMGDLNYKKRFNMMNIRGDSIVVNYKPVDPYLNSNGIFYDYANFVIPDSLFSGSDKFEGEWLARTVGVNKYAFRKNVTLISTKTFDVLKSYIANNDSISNDSILTVNFDKGYVNKYTLSFKARNMFPGKYRMVVYTHMDIGGIYDIYVNDHLVTSFDYTAYTASRGLIKSVTGITFVPTGRYNKFDCYLQDVVTHEDVITDYGQPTVRFDYKGPGRAPYNGLVIDVIKFLPVAH